MQLFLSSSFSKGLSSTFFFVLLLSFIFEICNSRNPPLDPPMPKLYIHLNQHTINEVRDKERDILNAAKKLHKKTLI